MKTFKTDRHFLLIKMKEKIHFTKMHGLGNNYFFIDCITGKEPSDPESLAKQISDKNVGIGSDGVILIMKPENSNFDAKMRIFNADGSEGEMCGNGIRCVAKYMYDNKLSDKKELAIETEAGIIKTKIISQKDGVSIVEVDMGIAVVKEEHKELQVNGKKIRGSVVSLGNPHFVTLVDDLNAVKVEDIGPQIENHAEFPDRINVEFVQIKNDHELIMRVWERGSGITMACGTGACASAAAAHALKKIGKEVTVHLLGGPLNIKIDDTNHILMTGPAETISSGEYEYETKE